MLRSLPLVPFAACPLVLLAACAGHAPAALPSVPGTQAGWIAPVAEGALPPHWWAALADPALNSLIAQALAANPDLGEAEARLRSARATLSATRARELPQINASGSATTNAQSANGMIPFGKLPGVSRTYDLFDAGFDAAWEIDLWGARASAARAAAARRDRSAAQAQGLRLQIIAEVARSYTELRSAQLRSANYGAQVEALSMLSALQQQRQSAGESPRDDVLAAAQRLAGVRAALAGVQAEIAANAYALAVLTGQAPEALLPLADAPGPIPAIPDVTLLGLRSEVLLRRPDVAAATDDLAAARADVSAARAALFPSLSLTGSIGQQARNGGDFTAADSSRYSFGPSLHWPLFAAGQLRAQLRGSRALADAAAARYQKAVLSALSDSETAANRLERARQSRAAAEEAAAAASATGALAQLRFTHGEDTRGQALEARLAALVAEQSALSARAAAATAWIALGKALGASD